MERGEHKTTSELLQKQRGKIHNNKKKEKDENSKDEKPGEPMRVSDTRDIKTSDYWMYTKRHTPQRCRSQYTNATKVHVPNTPPHKHAAKTKAKPNQTQNQR